MDENELLFKKALEIARKIVENENSRELETELEIMNNKKDQLVDLIYYFVKINAQTKNARLIKEANSLLETILSVATKNITVVKEVLDNKGIGENVL